jgi:alpha-L-rhamnosidase
MNNFYKFILMIVCACPALLGVAQTQNISPQILNAPWKASWIAVPGQPAKDYGIYHFRKQVQLTEKPSTYLVHVSADNRYKLYVNQTLVSLGPARGDMYYWNYETVDLAPYLKAGNNTIAALVWNEGDYMPQVQMSLRTAFIMQGNSDKENVINTNETWKCIRNEAYHPLTGIGYGAYYVAGPGEQIDMSRYVKNWNAAAFDDSNWKIAVKLDRGNPKGIANAVYWRLVPSSIPHLELPQERILSLRTAEGVKVPASFPAVKTTVTIPANTKATLLLDQTYLTNAYVTLNFSKGKNASIRLGYGEAMMNNLKGTYGITKGNRNNVDNTIFAGRRDSIIADGSDGQTFTTLAWRTFRYIKMDISTADEPLMINDIYGTFTGYPFVMNAKLENATPEMQKMLDIGWHTARLCAGEIYTDCPYYEQLQYIGDTRIQALLSFYNSGDDRLVRNALNLMDHSRLAEGVTMSRHPSYTPQIISTFSLWYVGMLHDYWMYRPDSAFIKDKLAGGRGVLDFFSRYQDADGSVKNSPYWAFTDWVDTQGWDFGQSPKGKSGSSATIDLQLLWACRQQAEMEAAMGSAELAAKYRAKAAQLKAIIQKKYWDAGKQLYADTEEKQLFSQHANSLAVLAGMISGQETAELCKKLETDASLTQCTIYFKYYLHQALTKGGLGNNYMQWLGIWRENIKWGLTTWAEMSDLANSRSDCHAWGASPNIEFYRVLLGIDSDAPGFSKIKIEPHLGDLKKIGGEIPHPNGKIKVMYVLAKGKWHIQAALPVNTTGTFVWQGKSYPLKAGDNKLVL